MSDAPQTLTVVIPLKVKRRGGRKAMLTPGGLALHGQQDITLIKAVARAFRWRRMLETGRYATIDEIAAAEKINDSYVSRVLRLTLLAPDIVEAILDGRQPEGLRLPGLLKGVAVEWEGQRMCFLPPPSGFPSGQPTALMAACAGGEAMRQAGCAKVGANTSGAARRATAG